MLFIIVNTYFLVSAWDTGCIQQNFFDWNELLSYLKSSYRRLCADRKCLSYIKLKNGRLQIDDLNFVNICIYKQIVEHQKKKKVNMLQGNIPKTSSHCFVSIFLHFIEFFNFFYPIHTYKIKITKISQI